VLRRTYLLIAPNVSKSGIFVTVFT